MEPRYAIVQKPKEPPTAKLFHTDIIEAAAALLAARAASADPESIVLVEITDAPDAPPSTRELAVVERSVIDPN